MTVRLSNNVRSTLRLEAASGDTTIYLPVGHGARFPALGVGEYFYATLEDAAGNTEIVQVTARAGDVLTATRGAEGTTPRTFVVGSAIEMRVTAASVLDAAQDAADGVDLGQFGVTASASELNILDGVTASTAELNILDGVTASTAELNILDGVTASTAELNILDGVTASTAELNILDGVTASTAELNYLGGVTSSLQVQLDSKQAASAGLTSLSGIGSNGLVCRIASNSFFPRSITGTTDQITVTNGDGVSGDPTISAVIPSLVEAQVGAITTKLMNPQRTRDTVMFRLPRPWIVVYPNNNTFADFTNSDPTPNQTVRVFFSNVRNTSTSSASLRFRVSTDSGSTWSSYFSISSATNWTTGGSGGVWGELTIWKQRNVFAGQPGEPDFYGGFRFQTNNGTGLFPFSASFPNETDATSLFNKIEISWSTGNLTGGSIGFALTNEVGI